MSSRKKAPTDYVAAIAASGLTIYDPIEVGSELWIPSKELERILSDGLKGFDTAGMPPKTRAKIVRKEICAALGYSAPASFKRIRPKFPGQAFDPYVQAADNLQVWNDEITPKRRYVLVRPGLDGKITRVKVVSGADFAALDRSSKLTQKYQARLLQGTESAELISQSDTKNLSECLSHTIPKRFEESPLTYPTCETLLPISDVYRLLRGLLGRTFQDGGAGQDRNRGAELHRLVCDALRYSSYKDDGRFPDLTHQLLEIKLQLKATIDLGTTLPSSEEPLDLPKLNDRTLRPCDVRYALFCGESEGGVVRLTRFYLTSGLDFFTRFPQCQGKVLNKKLQLHLPGSFFATEAESLAN
ncbi:MAG: restriction endonuclease [Blastocatellia bacterium]|nr:restriction endonuclease [Blastocatellia bacterium]